MLTTITTWMGDQHLVFLVLSLLDNPIKNCFLLSSAVVSCNFWTKMDFLHCVLGLVLFQKYRPTDYYKKPDLHWVHTNPQKQFLGQIA